MSYRPDPIKEHAYLIELSAHQRAARDAANGLRHQARRALDDGCRSTVIAEHLGMSRATFYRWLVDFD